MRTQRGKRNVVVTACVFAVLLVVVGGVAAWAVLYRDVPVRWSIAGTAGDGQVLLVQPEEDLEGCGEYRPTIARDDGGDVIEVQVLRTRRNCFGTYVGIGAVPPQLGLSVPGGLRGAEISGPLMHRNYPARPRPQARRMPADRLASMVGAKVPDTVGLSVSLARRQWAARGYMTTVRGPVDGMVTAQDPAGGTDLLRGSSRHLALLDRDGRPAVVRLTSAPRS